MHFVMRAILVSFYAGIAVLNTRHDHCNNAEQVVKPHQRWHNPQNWPGQGSHKVEIYSKLGRADKDRKLKPESLLKRMNLIVTYWVYKYMNSNVNACNNSGSGFLHMS